MKKLRLGLLALLLIAPATVFALRTGEADRLLYSGNGLASVPPVSGGARRVLGD